MNYSLGAFVVGVGHVLGWIAVLCGMVFVAGSLVSGQPQFIVIGLMVIAGAVPSLILATIGSAQLVTAQSLEYMHQKMEAEALAARMAKPSA